MTNNKSVHLPLMLAAAMLLGLTAAAPLTGEQQLPRENLLRLSKMIQASQAPEAELVFDAYEEYVKLHKIEAGLAGGSNLGAQLLSALAVDSSEKADAVRQEIGQILREPYVKIISENLFSLLPDNEDDGKLDRTDKLRRKLTRAISEMGF